MDISPTLDIISRIDRLESLLHSQIDVIGSKLVDMRGILISMSEEITLLRQEMNQLSGIVSHL